MKQFNNQITHRRPNGQVCKRMQRVKICNSNSVRLLLILIFPLLSGSCAKMDDHPIEFNQVSKVYEDSVYVRYYLNAIYNYIPQGYNRLNNSMLDASTDLAVNNRNNSPAYRIGTGAWGTTNSPDSNWDNNYRGIRAVNIFFHEIAPNLTERVFRDTINRNTHLGQAHFLRALFYSELLRRYGGVPIIEDIYDADDVPDVPRSSFDETVSYIVAQCRLAADLLPQRYPGNNVSDFGRATKGAALALKSRVLLFAASPLYNDPANNQSTAWQGVYDQEKWNLAAEAAYQVIALDEYTLFPSYANFFINVSASNRELIFNRVSTPNNDVERINGPTGITGGEGATGPSLNLFNSYLMSDGTPFSWNNPDHAANPFQNREARFGATFLWNGRAWMNHVIETFDGGVDMQSVQSTKTGFYLRKFKDEDARWFGGQQGVTRHNWPILRYAEVLLNFAEAMNEAYGPDADPKGYGMTAVEAIERIRERGQINPHTLEAGLSRDVMREKIYRERKVELAFEEHRPFDLRRWKLASDVLNSHVRGLQITQKDDGTYDYQEKIVENRVFTERMYRYPIPQSEIDKNPVLTQNPGW